jgi:hypothetical protein
MGGGCRVFEGVAGLSAHPQPNQALEPTPYSVRCAPAFGRGSPRALSTIHCSLTP